MICGVFHSGSGLGNQLFRYVMARVLALDKGTEFGMVCPENFKGKSFMNLDMGIPVDLVTYTEQPSGKVIVDGVWEENSIEYNPSVFNIDKGVIDGEFQDERYFAHYRKDIEQWLKVESMEMPDDLCVINFRGGEFKGVPDLYLTHDYWSLALSEMRAKGISKFIVCTDDVNEAQKFFPDFEVMHEIGRDWRMIRYAKHLILSNSSFAIFPAWLGQADIIAPFGWGRRNRGYWHLPQNKYKTWRYL